MERLMFKMRCKKGMEEEYIRKHKILMQSYMTLSDPEPVAPEEERLCDATWRLHKRAGISNYSIFMKEGILYAYFESEDARLSLDGVTAGEIGRRWQAYMEGILEQEGGKPVFEIISAEVFHMD